LVTLQDAVVRHPYSDTVLDGIGPYESSAWIS
jgi:hypothetical protein